MLNSIIISHFPTGCFPSSCVERVGPICSSCVESREAEESSNNVVGKRVRYSFLIRQLLVMIIFLTCIMMRFGTNIVYAVFLFRVVKFFATLWLMHDIFMDYGL